jgi:hypothetical protein
MKKYYSDTKLTFGKYEGKVIEEILHSDPEYIEWCMINLDHFHIDHNLVWDRSNGYDPCDLKPLVPFSMEAAVKNREKGVLWENEADESNAAARWANLKDSDGFDPYEGDQTEWYGHND